MKIEVSNGEIIDKLTIIQIKLERIKDKVKLLNLRKEFDVLFKASSSVISNSDPLYKSLYQVNCELWDIENQIRDFERKNDFGEEFISTARAVYIKNDKRSELKREINIKTASGLIEEKSYEKY
jgi:hypothetical protein